MAITLEELEQSLAEDGIDANTGEPIASPQQSQQPQQPQAPGMQQPNQNMPSSVSDFLRTILPGSNKYGTKSGAPNDRTVTDALRDVMGGLAKGSQQLGSAMLEGGEYLTRKGAEKMLKQQGIEGEVPKWNAREFMGLEGNNPIDLQKMIQSDNPDALASDVGQYGLAAGAGGLSMAKQAMMAGAYGASQAKPGQENLIAPNGRGGTALEDAIMASLLMKAPSAIKYAGGKAGKMLNYLRPGKDAEAFVKGLTPGIEGAEKNIGQLSERVSQAKEAKKVEALGEKKDFMANAGTNRVLPSQKDPLSLPQKIAKIFNFDSPVISKHQKASLAHELNKYMNSGDIDALIEKGEDIFHHPGLSEKSIQQLEESLTLDKPIKTNYQKIKSPDMYGDKNIYNETMKQAHEAYMENPTIRNADKLQSKLFSKQKNIKKQMDAGTADDDQIEIYKKLVKNRGKVLEDINKHIETLPPEQQEKYSTFRKLWREQVTPYTNPGKGRSAIREMASGRGEGVKQSQVSSAFSYPNKQVKTILEHIGEPGKKNILANHLMKIDPTDARGIADAILKFQRQGGSEYVSPEIEAMAKALKKRANAKNTAIGLGGTAVGGGLGGALYNHFFGSR